MRIELDWQAGDEAGRWEIVARIEKPGIVRVPPWVWRVLLPAVVLAVAAGYLGLRYRYTQALHQVASQVQDVIDLEALALARQDLDLYLSQQDRASPAWYRQQRDRAWVAHFWCAPDAAGASEQQACAPVPRVEVKRVEVVRDVAWVEVVAGPGQARQMRFYRQTDLGWKHTAPQAAFWQEPVRLARDSVVAYAGERDRPHVEPLLAHMASVARDVEAALGSAGDASLEVRFVAQDPSGAIPGWTGRALVLPSPWLTGIPLERAGERAYLDELTYWVAYAMAARSAAQGQAARLDPLQRAVVAEFARWYSRGDTAQTPILKRVAATHGEAAIPSVVRSQSSRLPASEQVTRWLFASAPDERRYVETLADIAREAVLAGQEDTLALADLMMREAILRRLGGTAPYEATPLMDQILSEEVGRMTR